MFLYQYTLAFRTIIQVVHRKILDCVNETSISRMKEGYISLTFTDYV
jgi:hypothetical protein